MLPITAMLLPIVLMTSCKDDDKAESLSPTIMVTSPVNNANDVAGNMAVTVTFSEAMDASTINISTFTIKQGDISISGEVEYEGEIATFTPYGPLDVACDYTAYYNFG